jgi:hypothetical protein
VSETSIAEASERARGSRGARTGLGVEIVEGLLLALVAVLTAWSGYEAALWNSKSAVSYGQAQALRSAAQSQQTLAGQQMLYDASTFDTWLVAAQANNTGLMSFIERRFRPEFKVAFEAWLATDPLHNPAAPPGPAAMPQYRNANLEQAASLDRSAVDAFNNGNHQRDVADEHVRVTVLLAGVLFLTALSQRFDIAVVRRGIIVVAIAVFIYSLYALAGVDA